MSEYRALLEKVGERITPAPDEFERLERLRAKKHRERRLASAVVALVVAAAGTLGAFAAFRGPGPTQPGAGDEESFHALWPEQTFAEAQAVQGQADAGDPDVRWRLHADEFAGGFAEEVLGWKDWVAGVGTPNAQGILFDRPDVVERARTRLAEQEVADRLEVVAGDFFVSVPGGADAYLLRHVLHDWDDERAAVILRNCQQTMKPTSRLLIVESLVPPGNGPSSAKLLDLAMMVLAGGMERTEAEYRALLEATGCTLTRILPTGAGVSVLEARKTSEATAHGS